MTDQTTDTYLRLPRRRYFSALEWHAAAIGTIAAAVLVIGYGFNFSPMQTIVPGFPTMKPRTAAMLMTLALSFLLSLRKSQRALWASSGLALGVAIFVIWMGLSRTVEVPNDPWAVVPSNATIFGLFISALAMLMINHTPRLSIVAAVLALVAATPALFRILALLLFRGAPDDDSPLNTMALHTATLLVWFLLVCVMLHPKLGIARPPPGQSAGPPPAHGPDGRRAAADHSGRSQPLPVQHAWRGGGGALRARRNDLRHHGRTVAVVALGHCRRLAEAGQRTGLALSRANEALEQYASSAAHDLKAPARHVMLYGELLDEALAKSDIATARRHAKAIRDSALEMPKIIDGMLDFSRSAFTRISLSENSLSELVQAGSATNARNLEAAGARVFVLHEIRLRCDSTLMTTVFHNLVANAVQNRRKDRPWRSGSTACAKTGAGASSSKTMASAFSRILP